MITAGTDQEAMFGGYLALVLLLRRFAKTSAETK
jgi:hypothetical protein